MALEGLRDRIRMWLFPQDDWGMDVWRRMLQDEYLIRAEYSRGIQRRQLVARPGQADDNLVVNLTGLVIERSVSLLFGQPITFNSPNESELEYVDQVWDANKRQILLHKTAQLGGTFGTCYVKILPDGIQDGIPRLIALNPMWLSIDTMPEDVEAVRRYTVRYNYQDDQYNIVSRKEVTERVAVGADGEIPVTTWVVREYMSSKQTGGRWVLTNETPWPFPFPPIHHWQNLPDALSCYGLSDIDDIIPVQDRFNFANSNFSKILRYHGHPKTWYSGAVLGDRASWGADEMIGFRGDNAKVENLEMKSDLASSRLFMNDLRQILFDISRTVDMASVADRVGSLTNFGLRTLMMDALSKLGTKRMLYGDGLTEINRRLLSLNGVSEPKRSTIIWPNPLPEDEKDEADTIKVDLENGLVSHQTASEKRGYDWTTEQERMGANNVEASTQ